MVTIERDIFGNVTSQSKQLSVSQLSLFSAHDEMTMAAARSYQLPIDQITDRLTAAMIGKKYLTAQGLAFKTGLTMAETHLGLTTLKLGGRVSVSVTKKRIDEELYSLN